MPVPAHVLQMRDIVVRFGAVIANNHIDFDLKNNEIHALLGENGAGKTTLMRVLAGLVSPESGEIWIQDRRAQMRSASDAMAFGVGMVHQHFMLIPTLSVAANVSLGLRSAGHPFPDLRRVAEDLRALGNRYGLQVDPYALVADLSVGAQQRVEVLKSLYRGARILVLDEPTSVLTPQEAKGLFAVLHALVTEGTAIVFISHKLNEVMALSDRVTVLRAGRVVASRQTADTTAHELASLMIGRDVHQAHASQYHAEHAKVSLRVEGLRVRDDRGVDRVKEVDFTVHEGEVLGVAGVDGNGQRELAEAIVGLRKPTSGRIALGNADVTFESPHRRIELGLAHIPEDRQSMGLLLDLSVMDNAVLEVIGQRPYSQNGWLNRQAIEDLARRLIRDFGIRTEGPNQEVEALSGGNQQKVVLAREMSRSPRVLIAMQPTRGLDVGAMEQIHIQLLALASAGCAVLLVSTELDEILVLSHRVLVMFDGRIMGGMVRSKVDVEKLGLWMAGQAS